jgi:hypothetical protein
LTSGTARRTRPPPPKSSPNPDGKASLPDAELAALTRGSHYANEKSLPTEKPSSLPASEIAAPASVRDRRAPPPESQAPAPPKP